MTISTCSAACAALAGSCPPPAGAAPPHSGSEVRRGWADESSALGDCGLESGWSAAAASDELLRTVRAALRPAACVGSNTGGRQSARGTPSSVPVPAGPPPNTPYTSQPDSRITTSRAFTACYFTPSSNVKQMSSQLHVTQNYMHKIPQNQHQRYRRPISKTLDWMLTSNIMILKCNFRYSDSVTAAAQYRLSRARSVSLRLATSLLPALLLKISSIL